MGPHFGRMGVQHSHFSKPTPTLGRVKSSIPQELEDFIFFQFYFLKLVYTRTFISSVGILV
jgi:hypothetical protein